MVGYELEPIGWVESALTDLESAPRQGDEGAPDAWLAIDEAMAPGLRDLAIGDEVIVLTWLDRGRRDELTTRPRGDPNRPVQGVFSTRSPDRPNPIGLHTVVIVAIEGTRIRVRNLEAIDRTPILDIKPILEPQSER
jgi:tRNA-Thr(GGU) m(6)t(6)A37 methyltransferase TsaA